MTPLDVFIRKTNVEINKILKIDRPVYGENWFTIDYVILIHYSLI